mmetsp:Transcript_40112/g.103860  ORF Transcript_40112/g.103860 Transcript_40112/m.103860 type:complete len:135 (+) Transcript_40112:1609-2013(+)
MSDNETLKLADFGVAKQIAKATLRKDGQSTSLAGTPLFMAPELMEGSQASEKADVWSIGCVLLEIVIEPPLSRREGLLGAKVLSNSSAVQELINSIRPMYSVRMKRLLERMLRVDPTQRPSCNDLLKELVDGPP